MGLVEHQNLLVTGTVVTGIDAQPDLGLHVISSPNEFSPILTEESLNHARVRAASVPRPDRGRKSASLVSDSRNATR